MSEEKRDQERADRDQERSEEARWRVAETGAVEEPTPPRTPNAFPHRVGVVPDPGS